MNIRYTILSLVFLLIFSFGSAQNYGNEWINYSQKYYKISTVEDGIYRISYDDLTAAGFPVATVDPRNIQLIHRGIEQAIHISGQGDGVLNDSDFIEFYGKRNDGTLDEELYTLPEAHKRKFHNFYSDTTAYFLTWSLSETGKRMISFRENNILNLPPESYHFNEKIQLQSGVYTKGLHYPAGYPGTDTQLSAFDYGEGWTGSAINRGQFTDIVFANLDNGIISGPKPILEILLTGGNNLSHTVDLSIGSDQGSLRSLATINFNYYYDTLINSSLEWTDIANGNLTCRVAIPDNGVADRISVSYARLTFAESWDNNMAEQKVFTVAPTNSNRSYIEILNVPVGAKLFDITNENNLIEIGYNTVGADINAVIENDLNGRKLLLTSRRIQTATFNVASIRNIDASKADFIIITHKDLRKPASQYQDVPKAYGSYRASSPGGGYDTLVININQLYNTFSYGEYTSLAIYRFCRYMAQNGDPKYFFLMGKGLAGYNLRNARSGSTDLIHKDFVPTAGFPGSDMLFTVGLNGTTSEPGIPVGRISAKSALELEAYFNKVKEFESTAPTTALWHKDIIHLSGGGNVFQQSQFRRYVDGFKSIAEGENLGGRVVTFSKRTTEPEEFINISEEVNKGKILVTFFGHSGSAGADMDIGYVSNSGYGYNNKGKYPVLIVNGCLAGDMYNPGYGFGEDWIATPDKGAVGFIAHTNSGLSSRLKRYMDIFYETAFTDTTFIHQGVGFIQKEVAKRYLERYANSEIDIAQVQQMALQGDPSIALFRAALPDFEITSDNVFFQTLDGEPINAFTEVFNIGLIVRNFGRTHEDSLKITINRRLSNGNDISLDTLLYKSVPYKDTLLFPIESIGLEGFGINQFSISIDPLNEIEEVDETNNSVVVEEFIMLGGTANVYPLNYSIVNKANLKLVAQPMDLLSENKTFKFELDTTKLFNSSYRRQNTLSVNTLAKWEVNLFESLPELDSVVFYWRTIFADDTTGIWNTSSFTYIKDGTSGWAMNHFQQFDGAIHENVLPNRANRKWEFEQFETSVSVRTFGTSHEDFDYENVEMTINGSNYIFPTRLCTNNSMNFVAFDKANTVPYLGLGQTYILDRRNCGKHPSVINNMLNNEIENNLMIEQYIDAVSDGDFVVLFSIGNVTYPNWPPTTWTKLGELGISSSDLTGLQEGEPVIILGRKGSGLGTATIMKADYSSPTPASEQEIFLETIIHGKPTRGVISSPKIGPSSHWISFHQKVSQSDSPPTDNYFFNIYGINTRNEETLLHNNISTSLLDLQNIDHPYLRVEMLLEDETNITPPQLKNWFVIYEGVPEGVISFKEGQGKEENKLAEGETYQSNFAFENVSALDFADSITVEYSIFNQAQRKSYIDTIMIKPLVSEEAQDFTLELNTLGKVGKNDLKVFANPYVHLEQNYNNNFINLVNYLSVEHDSSNPIMEVTVDGEFIMDGDIVTPSPMIVLRLKDDNAILLKEDTLGVNIYLNEKGVEEATRISFSSPNVNWNPATAESDFTVEFQPQTLADGVYTLKAEAADASGNLSGTEPYSVSFEIVNESQITNFFPYPNPFSTRTQFVFTLTGSDIPDEIIIQIMTVNGTVVREITQDEIGPIKIGNNKTEYAWDGKDEYGDQLANGVYLYKVKIYNNGEEMKHRGTSADRAFKHGVGKIYLLK